MAPMAPRAKRTTKRPPLAQRKKPAKADGELIKMSELAKRSGVPGPTIKHYIREGLLPGPEVRTSRNMAYYDARLASRIRVIKDLQAARFLPLRVIGELLETAPSDKIKPDRDAAQRKVPSSLAPAFEQRTSEWGGGVQRRKRSEVIKTFGVTRAELDQLEKAGVLELRGEGETAGYGGADLRLLDLLADVRRLGFGGLFPASVAAAYLVAVTKLVELEIDVFRDRVLDDELARPPAEVAKAAVELGERLIVALRAKLLPAQLGRLAPR